jgi:uncharacterized protein (DUF58 family)
VATLLSLIIISGIMSEATLRGIKVDRHLPPLLFKGSSARVTIRISNSKKLLPSYSFKVTEIDGPSASAYVLKLGPSESANVSAEYTFQERGVHTLSGVRVSTRFPFGLFTKGKEEALEQVALVLPSISKGRFFKAPSGAPSSGASTLSGRGFSGGLYGLREYSLADDSRHIHWKSAARAERLLTKELERESDEMVVVVFEHRPRWSSFRGACRRGRRYGQQLYRKRFFRGPEDDIIRDTSGPGPGAASKTSTRACSHKSGVRSGQSVGQGG